MPSKPAPILHIVEQVATFSTFMTYLGVLALLALLAGCSGQEPKGQVVAVVNGEEVTIPELNAEARARGLAIATDRNLRNSLVEELVQRKLLVQEALRRGLDRDPQYILDSRRMNEMLLVEELATSAGDSSAEPSDREVAEYVRSKPQAFGQRMLFSVEHLTFEPDYAPQVMRMIEDAPSLESIARFLREAGVASVPRQELWDSATIPAEWHEQLLGASQGETVLFRQPDRAVAVQLLSATPYPVPEEQRTALARQMIRQERHQAILQRVLQQVQSNARIDYQDEFGP